MLDSIVAQAVGVQGATMVLLRRVHQRCALKLVEKTVYLLARVKAVFDTFGEK